MSKSSFRRHAASVALLVILPMTISDLRAAVDLTFAKTQTFKHSCFGGVLDSSGCKNATAESAEANAWAAGENNTNVFAEGSDIDNKASQVTVTSGHWEYDERNEIANRSNFVVHVGPHKTGSTTIQFGMAGMKKWLVKDSYTLIPQNQSPRGKDAHQIPFPFVDIVKEQEQNGQGNHIFLSSEYLQSLPKQSCQAWRKLILTDKGEFKWNFEVVIVYRRLHSYLPSAWNQRFKHVRDEQGQVKRLGHFNWPGIYGDTEILSLEEWITMNPIMLHHTAHQAYTAWRQCFKTARIRGVNFHAKGDLFTNFVCKAVTGANHTCSGLANISADGTRGEKAKSNPSVNLDYDMLATRAYGHGLIGKDLTRHKVVQAIENFVKKANVSLPMKCPNATVLDRIYEQSLEAEKWASSLLLNDDAPLTNHDMISEFNTDWNITVEQQKLCSVDAAKALKQDLWIDFFGECCASGRISE